MRDRRGKGGREDRTKGKKKGDKGIRKEEKGKRL